MKNMKLNRELQDLCINTIRMLSADAVQNANAGHPACRWAPPQWPSPFGRSFLNIILATRGGSTAIVSYCLRDTGRCCYTASCI